MIKPILDNVVVKPFPPNETTEGGLYVPDSVKKDSNKVTVVAVGGGTKKNPMKLKAGDVGFRVKEWGEEIIIDGGKYFIMNQSAIIALE